MSERVKYKVLIWCRDCTGQDERGCFDGGSEYLNEGQLFDSFQEAETAGALEVKDCGLWEFDVVDQDGEEIETPQHL